MPGTITRRASGGHKPACITTEAQSAQKRRLQRALCSRRFCALCASVVMQSLVASLEPEQPRQKPDLPRPPQASLEVRELRWRLRLRRGAGGPLVRRREDRRQVLLESIGGGHGTLTLDPLVEGMTHGGRGRAPVGIAGERERQDV